MIDNKHSAGMTLHNRMSAIDLQHLRYAVVAREQESFRRAAESLLVQQSTLSRCISQLEHSIGMTIFERSSGGVRATDGGRATDLECTKRYARVQVLISPQANFQIGIIIIHQCGIRFDDYRRWSAFRAAHLMLIVSVCVGGSGYSSPGPAGYRWLRRVHRMLESQTHLLIWAMLLFYWRNKQAVEIDPMQMSVGWLAGELRPPTRWPQQ
jgi:hypothetical protein